jgi:hypothetical protein
MSQDFARPTTESARKLCEEKLDGSYGGYEALKAAFRDSLGLPNPAAETMSLPPTPVQQAPMSAPAQQGGQHTHERRVYPHGNDAYTLTGYSEEELDAKEARIRALFQ